MGCPDVPTAAGGLSTKPYLTLPLLDQAGLVYFFGTSALDAEGIRRFSAPYRVRLRQVHCDRIVIVPKKGKIAESPEDGDGLATDRPGVLMTVSTADCLPVILIDPVCRAAAILHAGWRGSLLNIAGRGVATLKQIYGSHPESLLAGIGPGIGRCCFEVGSEVWGSIEEKYSYGGEVVERKAGEKERVDLVRLNRLQLIEAGLLPDRIASIDLCTACDPSRFYSYRRDRMKGVNMTSGVMWVESEGSGEGGVDRLMAEG